MNLKFTPKTYSVVEKPIDGFTASYSPQSMIANQVAEVSQFVVKNTKAKTGSVYVKYVDEEDKEIAEKTELKKDAPVGEDYSATPKVVEGYENGEWKEGSAPVNGKVEEGEKTVVYVYKKTTPQPKTGNVYVKYIAEDGTVLEAESAVKTKAPVGEAYTTEQKTFEGYEFSKMGEGSAPANGKVIEGDLHVVYVYKSKEKPNPDKPKPPVTNIITEYVDIYGNELIPSKDGDQPVEVIPGYEFIETRRTEKV